ncbi:hypothetical protein BDQ17DRAFT_1346533 [Cyathus striatus]|nr:hypothetical protein BDQ17DRAFT_1346533 [Cyathus striatus]
MDALTNDLWADISKANASVAEGSLVTVLESDTMQTMTPDLHIPQPPLVFPHVAASQHILSKKEEAIIATMKAILDLVANDATARTTLETASIPMHGGGNVLDMLQQCVHSNTILKAAAMPLSQVLVSLARSDVLFGTLRHSNASSIELNKGKRKRDETNEESRQLDTRIVKRPYIPDTDLHNQISEAVRAITNALATPPSPTINPMLYRGGPEVHALQEIGGLIQVIGVLSGIQIGHQPESIPGQVSSLQHNPAYPWIPNHAPPITDIGTAVYPCLIVGCRKTFSRLYSLRAHQRSHATHRPYRCDICPASFARNHDLKRHIKLHDRIAWKCAGCQKVFSRRDAIKRHKNGSKARGPKSEACVDADVIEVELDEANDDSLREERRAKLWNGIVVNHGTSQTSGYRHDSGLEEGEIQPTTVSGIQATIISLHGLLQAHVGNALGAPVGHSPPMTTDPTNGQATLASVIARAQLQNLPPAMLHSAPADDVLQANGDTIMQNPEDHTNSPGFPSLSMYGLSDEQTKLLEIAIANAASAAQAQAEAEAALEEERKITMTKMKNADQPVITE